MLQGLLLVNDLATTSKPKERQVFLFEQIIIISEAVGPKTQFSNPVYIYKNHLQVNKMALEEVPDDPLKFCLKSKDPHQDGLTFVMEAPTQEVHDEWVGSIRAILDTQMDFLRGKSLSTVLIISIAPVYLVGWEKTLRIIPPHLWPFVNSSLSEVY